MVSGPLDELYLNWLYQEVDEIDETDPSRTHWNLFKFLYTKEFVWVIPNDDNRVEDGRDLRYEFIHHCRLRGVDQNWMELGCSFLELLISLSRWLAFEANAGKPHEWFWHLLHTLELDGYTDNLVFPEELVDDILDTVQYRTYRPDGVGGLFPLRQPKQDQREVEIWYQLNAYLIENGD